MSQLQPTGKRVVIESVEPQVDGGRFPVKRPLGDPVAVTAKVFADGHDEVACVLRHRLRGLSDWAETPMQSLNNDRWGAEFTPDQLGDWEYEVAGWVDHFATWRTAMVKRAEAGVDVEVNLLVGAELVVIAVGRSKGKDAKRLTALAKILGDEKAPIGKRLDVALSDELSEMMKARPDRSLSSTTGSAYPVMVDREKAVFSTWYELFPRSWSEVPGEHGTFAAVGKRLDYVAGMGFDVLYLPPIHPIGRTFRKGANNSLTAAPDDPGVPWAIGSEEGGHTAIDPALGTSSEFRDLISAAAEAGVELAMDIAFQCSPDHPWVTEHPEWFRHRPDGTIQYAENPPKKYQDIYPVDFETEDAEGLWKALRGVFDHWIDEGVRIFRVDNPHTKSFAFWEWVIAEIRSVHPDVILLAEAFTRPAVMYRLAKLGFNQSYTYFAWRNSRHEIVEYMADLSRVGEFFRPNFWPNTPDILTEQLQTGGRAAFITRYVLAATLSSNCGIYGPAYELMESKPQGPGSEEYLDSEKYQIREWDLTREDSIAPVIRQVNRARSEHVALQRNHDLVFHRTDNDMLICYSKSAGDDVVLVVVNNDPRHTQTGWVHLDSDVVDVGSGQQFQVTDVLTDRRYMWSGSSNYVELDPTGIPAHIFTLKRKARPKTEETFDYYS